VSGACTRRCHARYSQSSEGDCTNANVTLQTAGSNRELHEDCHTIGARLSAMNIAACGMRVWMLHGSA
jgi:hypothetical protein